ncbi:MAG: ectoine hydrolase [Saprospiraceae bacterium]|jgi:ectoine hydrolase
MPTNISLNFTVAEYAQRLANTQASMVDQGIELLIVVDPSNMAWLTGYDGWSFYTHQCVLISADGLPVWFGRGIDQPGAMRTCYMPEDHLVGYPDHYVQSTQCHPMEFLTEIIQERNIPASRIGVEMDNYYFSAAAYESLKVGFPNSQFINANALVNWQRAIKSEQEMVYIKRAAKIVERMHQTIYNMIEVGLPKNQLAAAIYQTGIEGADGHWGDYPAIVPILPTGMDATAAHLTWDDRPFEQGDITFFEVAGCHKRYHCPLSRTISLGTPPKKYKDAELAVLYAMEAGLAQAQAGNKCEDIAIGFFDELEKHGFKKNNRTGYSIGMSYPPDWGERTMSLRRGDLTELKPNMVLHFMPALWLDDGGLEITETIAITETGYERLANVAQKIFIK